MLEIIATVLTLIGVILNALKFRACFVIWFVANVIWLYIQWKVGIVGMAVCQAVFCGTCVWGWFAWDASGLTKTDFVTILYLIRDLVVYFDRERTWRDFCFLTRFYWDKHSHKRS